MSIAAAIANTVGVGLGGDNMIAFVTDEATHSVVTQGVMTNWPTASVHICGFRDALETLQQEISPPLVLVDIEGVGSPVEAARALLGACSSASKLVLLGVHNDVTLYRALIQTGVADYLVKPIDPEALSHALENVMRTGGANAQQARRTKVVAVIGSRGGVGASTIAVNMSWIMAHEMGKTVNIVDLDLQFGTVALSLDLEPSNGLREAFENPDRVDGLFIASAMTHESERLFVMSAEEPLEDEVNMNPAAFDLLLEALPGEFDFVMIDLPARIASGQRRILSICNTVIIVTDMTLPGMRDTARLAQLVADSAPEAEIKIVVNKAGISKAGELPKAEFLRGIEHPVSYFIPYDAKVAGTATNAGKTFPAVGPKSEPVVAMRQICEGLCGGKVRKGGSLLAKLLGGGKKSSEKVKEKSEK